MTAVEAVIAGVEGTEYKAGSLVALRAGTGNRATVSGKKIALFEVDGRVVATQGRCPHANGPLHDGEVEGTVLTCPWHGWTFDLHSGFCEEDPELTLVRYSVRVEGDDIMVTL